MTIEAILRKEGTAYTESLKQWDTNQKIHLTLPTGETFPASYTAEFSNCPVGDAYPYPQTSDTIIVPDALLENGESLYIWIVMQDEQGRTTRYSVITPIEQRGKPVNYQPTPEQQSAIDLAIEALNDAVRDCQIGVQHYPRIVDGMWEVWDVANQRWVSTFVKAEGEDGRSIIGAVLNEDYTLTLTFSDDTTYTTPSIRGAEGYSPSATVVKEGRAATITITDQNGTTTAQVYDADPTTIIDDTAGAGSTNKVWSANKNTLALSGKADLDANGKVPSSQLPSYVDDVLEYADLAHFPAEGETGKIYVTLDTNKTYRWGGSEYAEISASLALGETSSTAYQGDRGKIAYDHAAAKGVVVPDEALYKISANSEGHVASATAATLSDLTSLGAAPKNNPTFTGAISMGRKANTTVASGSVAVGIDVTANGNWSHAEGNSTTASGYAAHAEGNSTTASGFFAHAEGTNSVASGSYSHAEGQSAQAIASNAHAEGYYTQAQSSNAHAEGNTTIASGINSHSEGSSTTASGNNSHSEGNHATAIGETSHAEGSYTAALGDKSHTEGSGTTASGNYSHAEGGGTTASGNGSHAEGGGTTASGGNSHAEGSGTRAQEGSSHAEGAGTRAQGSSSHAEGGSTTASGNNSHAEGGNTTASGGNSHAEGSGTRAQEGSSHAEGSGTTASGNYSHAEGGGTTASGNGSHAEGGGTTASGGSSHAEGAGARAQGTNSHAEGAGTTASGDTSHAEGLNTIANASNSHVGGRFNVADSYASWDEWTANTPYAVGDKVKRTVTENEETTVTGYLCIMANSDSSFTPSKWTIDSNLNYAHIIGNGTADSARSNAYALGWDGNGHYEGDVYVGCNGDSTGGTKVAKITDIPTVPVTDVQVNGTSILNNGIANVPVATTSDVGVIKVGSGLSISGNSLCPIRASDADIKSGLQAWNIIVPATQERATFYGLAKAAGADMASSSNHVGTYTKEAQSAIKSMIGVSEEAYFINKKDFTNPTTVNSNASSVINAALIAAKAAGKNYCVIPEGEYWLTETIYLQDGVILQGCGMDATTLKIADDCDIDAIRVASPINNSGIMDLSIDGNRITNYSTFYNGHHGNAINVWLHYGRIERVRTNWVYKHSLLLNYDTGNSDDGLGFEPEHQNDMGNLNKVLWCDFRDSLLQGVMWGWRTMDSWMCYTNIGSHAANLYLEGGTSRFIGNHFDGDGDNGAGPEYNVYCGDGCKAMLFDGNIFENTQKQNIFFRQPSYSNQTMTITISNNIIRTCSKSQNEQYPNIYISGYSDSVKATEIAITGNQILNPDTNANHGYAGIHLAYCSNCKIIGNTFFNVGDNEVVVDNTCDNILNDGSLLRDVQVNGTSVVDGQGVANISLDTSLSLSNAAAPADKVGELKSAVTQYGKAFIVDPVVLRTKHFYISANGETNTSSSWTADIIQLGGETAIAEINAATNTVGFLACAFYNSNTISTATFISGAAFTKTGNETVKWVPIPAGAVLCVISSRTATNPNYSYKFVSAVNLPEFYNSEKYVDIMESEDAVFQRGYVLSTGALVSQHYWNRIVFNCENVETLIKVKGQSNSSGINLVSFFADSDMTQYISGVNYSNISGDTINTLYNVKIPTTAKVCAVSSNSFSVIEIAARLKSESDTLAPLFIETPDQQLRCVFKDVLFDNDFTVIDRELWGGKIVDVDTGETTINIYKMDKGKHGITYYRSISTDFNHLNVFSYNPANDCLLFSNSSNDAGTEGNWFAIVKNPRGLSNTAELADVGIKYDVDVGYKVNAFWGDADLGENNIVYLVSNGIGLITKVMLNKTNGEFDGTYSVLYSHDTEAVGFVGGGCYWNNKLYIGDGGGLGYRELDLTDDTFKMVGTQFYDGSDLLNGSSQGMHLDAKYLWRMLNKGGTKTNWLIQYYR